MKKTLIILIMVLSSIGYGAWDNTKPADSGTWNTAAGYIRANWDALEAILGTDLSTFDVNIITVDTAHVGAFDVNTIDANAADITTLTATNATISGVITAGATIVMSTSGIIYNNTTDGNDTGGMTIQGGGNASISRGAAIYCFGNEHATYPGRIILLPGYSSGTVDASIDASAHKIMNVVDPCGMQDAATKNYVDTKTGTGTASPTAVVAGTKSITFATGLIIKFGSKSIAANTTENYDYGDNGNLNFPTGVLWATTNYQTSQKDITNPSGWDTATVYGLNLTNGDDQTQTVYFMVWGY